MSHLTRNSGAFPCPEPYCDDGMTYREWLAGITAAAIAGSNFGYGDAPTPAKIADEAVALADAVIARLNRVEV